MPRSVRIGKLSMFYRLNQYTVISLRLNDTHGCDGDTTLSTHWRRSVSVEGKNDQFPQSISGEKSLSLGEQPLEALDSRRSSEEVIEQSILA